MPLKSATPTDATVNPWPAIVIVTTFAKYETAEITFATSINKNGRLKPSLAVVNAPTREITAFRGLQNPSIRPLIDSRTSPGCNWLFCNRWFTPENPRSPSLATASSN